MNDVLEQTAQLLEGFSADLANAWRTQPFNRVTLARAFARGFVDNVEDDVHPTAMVVLDVAMLDQELRRAAA